jgi:hypothetical protein
MVPVYPLLVQIQQVRKLALSLPETTERPHFRHAVIPCHGKIFAIVPPSKDVIHIFLDEDEIHACISENPDVFEELWWGKRLQGVRVLLRSADGDHVGELLHEAWRRKAPKRAIAALEPTSP